MNIEWVRLITILIALFTLVEYIRCYVRHRQPIFLAPIIWILLVVGYTIFKWVVDGLPEFYNASVIWSNVILINGILLLLSFLVVFKGMKPNGK